MSPSSISDLAARILGAQQEHERRLREDSAYREEYQKKEEARIKDEENLRTEVNEIAEASKEERRSKAKIPKRLWSLLDSVTLEETTALAATRSFMGGSHTFLILGGSVGTGKTTAAAWALDHERKERIVEFSTFRYRASTALFVKAQDLIRISTWSQEEWEYLQTVDRLAIDELGRETRDSKGWAAANFYDLLDARYDDSRKTIMTCNFTQEEFLANYCTDGGRLRDRLREVGRFVMCLGASLRKPIGQK